MGTADRTTKASGEHRRPRVPVAPRERWFLALGLVLATVSFTAPPHGSIPGVSSVETLASRLPQLPYGSSPPAGTTWRMSAAGACNRSFPDEVELHPDAALHYDGGTVADVLRDATTYGARWRMAAVGSDSRTIKATTEWCTDPVPPAPPAAPAAAGASAMWGCRCNGGLHPGALAEGSNQIESEQGEQP